MLPRHHGQHGPKVGGRERVPLPVPQGHRHRRGRRAIKGILIQFTRPDGQADPMAEAAGNGVPDTGPTATEAPSYRDPFAA